MAIVEVPVTGSVSRSREGKITIAGSAFATSSFVPGETLANDSTTTLIAFIPLPADFDHSQTQVEVDVFLGNDAASSGNAAVSVTASPIVPGSAYTANLGGTVGAVIAEPGEDVVTKVTFSPIADDWTAAEMMSVEVERTGAAGPDTGTEDLVLVGVAVRYKSKSYPNADW